MEDIISDPGLAVISRIILGYLDIDDLKRASKVSRNWHEFIAQEKSLWLKHFKLLRKCKEEEERKDWRICLSTFQSLANFDEMVELIQMMKMHASSFSDFSSGWLEDPLVAVCKYGTLKLFKAYMRLYNLDVNTRLFAQECGINTTVLHIAAAVDNLEIVQYILPLAEGKEINSFIITFLRI